MITTKDFFPHINNNMHIIDRINKIHFIGVGGISMSAIAKLMYSFNKKVTGSDSNYSKAILDLTECGIDAYIGSDVEKVKDAEVVVYSSAISPSDPELSEARSRNLPTVERHAFLGEIASYYDKCIAFAGTHGKTTSTAMLTHLFKLAKKEFTAHIGGYAENNIGNLFINGKEFFITEACEYKKSLLSLSPFIGVVLNADHDHPDTYNNIDEVYDVFDEFFYKVQESGKKIICYDTDYYKKRYLNNPNYITYGFEEGSLYKATNIKEYKKGYFQFDVEYENRIIFNIKLNIIGIFNIYNALATACIANILDINREITELACNSFAGVQRRFQKMGSVNGADIYIDYAHHPKEIKEVIKTANKIKEGRLIVVFQPHTYTRTFSLINEFVESLDNFDELKIVKSYSAREKPEQGMTAYELYQIIQHKGEVNYYENTLSLARNLCQSVKDNDTILILGAGDIDSIVDLMLD